MGKGTSECSLAAYPKRRPCQLYRPTRDPHKESRGVLARRLAATVTRRHPIAASPDIAIISMARQNRRHKLSQTKAAGFCNPLLYENW